jgi:hypothetical protein
MLQGAGAERVMGEMPGFLQACPNPHRLAALGAEEVAFAALCPQALQLLAVPLGIQDDDGSLSCAVEALEHAGKIAKRMPVVMPLPMACNSRQVMTQRVEVFGSTVFDSPRRHGDTEQTRARRFANAVRPFLALCFGFIFTCFPTAWRHSLIHLWEKEEKAPLSQEEVEKTADDPGLWPESTPFSNLRGCFLLRVSVSPW